MEASQDVTRPASPTTDYTAPQLFAAGQTVDLIQGACLCPRPLDHPNSWPVDYR